MSLLLRVNLMLATVFALAIVCAGYACRSVLQSNARREALVRAGLLLDSAGAIRDYTETEILPLLQPQLQHVFLPQSVPFYAATQNFLHLQHAQPQYSYKEATLNPTNPRDRAMDWEADVIQRFRDDADVHEFVGERATPMGPVLYLARPIRAQAGCMVCHSTAAAAPPTVIARYGSDNGFGWGVNEIIGAQMVSVPVDTVEASARNALQAFLLALSGVFAALLLVVDMLLYVLVIRPVHRMALAADQLSRGDTTGPALAVEGSGEVAALAQAFNRMRISLDKALRMLEARS